MPENNSKHNMKKFHSISFQLPILFIISFLVIMIIFLTFMYLRFESRMRLKYCNIARSVTELMSLEIDGDKIDEYIEKNYELDEYNRILDRFYEIRNSYPDIVYMYVYRLGYDGSVVVFDLEKSDGTQDAEKPGSIYNDFDSAFMNHMGELLKGEYPEEGLVGINSEGYLMTYCQPIYDSNGVIQCHACVDFSMDELHNEDIKFIINITFLGFLISIFIILSSIKWIKRLFVVPLCRMTETIESFRYGTQEDYENNIKMMENLSITSDNEIKELHNIFILVLKQSLLYMQNLTQAEDTIKFKNEQLGKISIKAFRDELTSVGNKAAYNNCIEKINEEIKKGERNFAIVICDVNDLKYINDKFGHTAGDHYIKGCCKIVCDKYKKSPVFRIGGDEFAVVLKNHDYEFRERLLREILEIFRESCEQDNVEPCERFSMSLGMAECTEDDKTAAQVMKRADSAMYEYKTNFKKTHGSYR